MLRQILDLQTLQDFETLADRDLRPKAMDVFNHAVEMVEASTDGLEIVTVLDNARRRISALYARSKVFDHDYSRFNLALWHLGKLRAQKIKECAK